MPRWRQVTGVALVMSGLQAASGGAQERTATEEEAYFRTVGEHFRVSSREIRVLTAWGLPREELPVVLFLARRTGGSPDALIARRRGGDSWWDVARGMGLDASSFHVMVPADADLGRLEATYRRFAETPRDAWAGLQLSDAEIVALVNVRVLGETLGVSPVRVLREAARTGSFVEAHRRLLESGVGEPPPRRRPFPPRPA